jgi:hypothetical protein
LSGNGLLDHEGKGNYYTNFTDITKGLGCGVWRKEVSKCILCKHTIGEKTMDSLAISTAVSGGITAGSHILQLLKNMGESTKSLGKIEICQQLIEVQLAMMDLLQKQQLLIEENTGLRNRNAELVELNLTSKNLELAHDAYWLRKKDGKLDGPFSTLLWDTKSQLVRMKAWEADVSTRKGLCDAYKTPPSLTDKFHEDSYVPQTFEKENGIVFG